MAGLPGAGPPLPWLDLPEEILGWEVLVRLPSKDLVRCGAVCRAWRGIASTHDILMAHHRHQPSLPLVLLAQQDGVTGGDLRAFDHRAAAEARLQPVARVSDTSAMLVEASCAGLLLLAVCTLWPLRGGRRDIICVNPTTRQMCRVPRMKGFKATGLYRHPPTGEYRLLVRTRSMAYDGSDPCYVLALGGNLQPPRQIGRPPESAPGFFCAPVAVRGNLHWSWWPYPAEDQTESREKITVFDTTAETFRLLRSPAIVQTSSREFRLYEVDGALGMYSCDDSTMEVDIWVMQDYDREVWSHEHHLELPMAVDIWAAHQSLNVMTVHDERRGVFVLYSFGQMLALADTEGNLSQAIPHLGDDTHIFFPGTHRIKEILVRHSFFSELQGALDVAGDFTLGD